MKRPDIDYSRLPSHMQEGARLYVEDGIEPGGFLMAVLCNDFVGAFSRADAVNGEFMRDWAEWLYNEAPSTCWGSREKVESYMASVQDQEVQP